MYRYIILLLIFSRVVAASTEIDCSDPKYINECAKKTFVKSEKTYNSFIKKAVIIMKERAGSEYVAKFLKIENNWKSLIKEQCNHVREFYQGGTLGATSLISCYETMYANRVNELKLIYDDVIGER